MKFRGAGLIVVAVVAVILIVFNRKDVTLIKQDNFEWRTVSFSGGELKSLIRLHNPNLLSSTIKNIDEKFSVNGVTIGILKNELEQGIPGMKESFFPVSIRFKKDDLYKAAGIDPLQKEITVTVDGKISFTNFTGGGIITIHQTENIILQ